MALNQYFANNYTSTVEQSLVRNLITEMIKMYGVDVQYIVRSRQNDDDFFGEDSHPSTFSNSHVIEMYIKSFESFEGEGSFLSRFNLEIRDSITFGVSRARFNTEVPEIIRPREGDVIYVPTVNSYFEVKFVEHEALFYQIGDIPVYEIKAELFEYSSEDFATGNSIIDIIDVNYEISANAFGDNSIIQTEANSNFVFTETNPFGEP